MIFRTVGLVKDEALQAAPRRGGLGEAVLDETGRSEITLRQAVYGGVSYAGKSAGSNAPGVEVRAARRIFGRGDFQLEHPGVAEPGDPDLLVLLVIAHQGEAAGAPDGGP